MRWTTLVALVLTGIVLCSCGSGEPDYSRVQAQTGGPEQGTWQDTSKLGTRLDLNSGKFTYEKDGGLKSTGTYKVANGQITLSGDGGTNVVGQWPDPNGPLTVDGESLQKTD